MKTCPQIALFLFTVAQGLTAQQPAAVDSSKPCTWDPRCSSPGVTLQLQEISRERGRRGTNVKYRLVPAGFPRDIVYTLWLWSAGSEPEALLTGFVADTSGSIVCGDSTSLRAVSRSKLRWCGGWISDWTAGGFLPGEPYRIALVSTDESTRANALAFPFPLQSSDGTCRLRLELVSWNAFAAWSEGFEPGDTLQTISRSGNEILSDSMTVLADSTPAPVIISPGVKGKRGGTATYTIVGRRCRVEVTYPWGNALKPR